MEKNLEKREERHILTIKSIFPIEKMGTTNKEIIMKNFTILTLIAVFLLSLSSCANQQLSKGEQGAGIGAASGAIIGQVIGRDTEATLLGTAIGTVLGYIIGNEMDKTDRQQLNQVYNTAPSGQTVSWVNPDTGNNYNVTAQPAYPNPNNNALPCRKAEILATIDGKAQKTYSTACLNNKGEWVHQN